MQKTLNDKMETTKQKWRDKVLAAQEIGEYLEPNPPEIRREFWKYGINPITGQVPSTITNQKRETDFNLPTT